MTFLLILRKCQERKNKIVDQLHKGVQHLMKQGKIDVYEGIGRILGPSIFSPMPGTISVEMNNGEENEMLIPKNVIVATGSRPRTLPGFEIDGEYVITSDEALEHWKHYQLRSLLLAAVLLELSGHRCFLILVLM